METAGFIDTDNRIVRYSSSFPGMSRRVLNLIERGGDSFTCPVVGQGANQEKEKPPWRSIAVTGLESKPGTEVDHGRRAVAFAGVVLDTREAFHELSYPHRSRGSCGDDGGGPRSAVAVRRAGIRRIGGHGGVGAPRAGLRSGVVRWSWRVFGCEAPR